MVNRNTYDGDNAEIEAVSFINSNKDLFVDYFDNLNISLNNSFVVRVTTHQFSNLSKKKC